MAELSGNTIIQMIQSRQCDEYNEYYHPMVFVWKRGSEIIYIGGSKRGMKYIITQPLPVPETILPSDTLELIRCNPEDIGKIKKDLYLKHKVKYPDRKFVRE